MQLSSRSVFAMTSSRPAPRSLSLTRDSGLAGHTHHLLSASSDVHVLVYIYIHYIYTCIDMYVCHVL